jgi:hypothetical protein
MLIKKLCLLIEREYHSTNSKESSPFPIMVAVDEAYALTKPSSTDKPISQYFQEAGLDHTPSEFEAAFLNSQSVVPSENLLLFSLRNALRSFNGRIVVCQIDTNAKNSNFAPSHLLTLGMPIGTKLAHPFYLTPPVSYLPVHFNIDQFRVASSLNGNVVYYNPFTMIAFSRPLFSGTCHGLMNDFKMSPQNVYRYIVKLACRKLLSKSHTPLDDISDSNFWQFFRLAST